MTHGTGTLTRRARPLERPVQDAEWHLCPREGVGAAALGPCLPALVLTGVLKQTLLALSP